MPNNIKVCRFHHIMWKSIPYKRGMQFSNKNVGWEAILSKVLSGDERPLGSRSLP